MSEGKIVITGPGRSGTTLLMQMLSYLGFDTGFGVGEGISEETRGGNEIYTSSTIEDHEFKRTLREAHNVVKSPALSLLLKEILRKKLIPVKLVIMPLRDMDACTSSRMSHPELLWKGGSFEERRDFLYGVVGHVCEACAMFDIPLVILFYPRFATDAKYLYNKLGKRLGLSMKDIKRAQREIVIPDWLKPR